MANDVPAHLPEPRILDRLFAGEPARHVLHYALTQLAPGRVAVVSSFGADSAVLLHLVASIDPDTPIVFLDTRKHFHETLAYREMLVERLGLGDVRSVRPAPGRIEQVDPAGDLHALEPDICCDLRKTQPMAEALDGFDAWITGRKRFQAATRQAMPLFEREEGRIKVNPLAAWSAHDVADYAATHDLPAHPLLEQGYRSIGCAPCTSPVGPGESDRAGRWRGMGKTECGIHLTVNGKFERALRHAGAGC